MASIKFGGFVHHTLQRLRPQNFRTGLTGRFFWHGLLAGALLCLLGVWFFVAYAQRGLEENLERVAGERLNLYAGTLYSALSKYSYLPHIMATNLKVHRLMTRGDNLEEVNLYLEDINKASGSMDLFVLDRNGNTIATSNWNQSDSFAGHKYRYRPYYQDAMRHGEGGYFGVGATTGRPGFFFTQAIRRDAMPLWQKVAEPEGEADADRADSFVGVAVTKVDLSVLQQEWRAGGETVFITDEHGVIFLSSNDEWRYRSTKTLPAQVGQDMLAQRQYGNTLPPPPLDMHTARHGGTNLLTIGNKTWLYSQKALEMYGWTLWFLKPSTALTRQVETYWIVGLGAVSLLLMLVLLIWAFYMGARVRREAREARRIRTINLCLAEEVRRRKKMEEELLAAQGDLLHAEHLAALGRVAASVAHELSQPVTSMRMFMSSCRRMVEGGRLEAVEETLENMTALVRRLETLIGQLKHFSRKSPTRQTLVPIHNVLDNTLNILRFKVESVGCVLCVECPEDAAVMANAIQLEQVCINLVHNALDALQGLATNEERRLDIGVEKAAEGVRLSITDNGPGIAPLSREHLFQPFFTTKKSGEGIGLGLSIVDKIVLSLGGEISVQHVLPHGTRFTLYLPRETKRISP